MERQQGRPTDPPRRLWFVYNPESHSSDAMAIAAVREAVAAHGGELVGETRFPVGGMVDAAMLDRRRVDTLITLGGDGTITTAATTLDDWGGRLLALPGGTMNLVPKALHGSLDLATIIARAFQTPRLAALPFARVSDRRSYARIIAGPAASFVHVREELRASGSRRMWRALRFAWKTLWMRSIRVEGEPGRYRAIFIRPGNDARLHFKGLEVSGPISAFRLMWTWVADLLGDETALEHPGRREVSLLSSRPVRMLLDGEESFFNAPVRIAPDCSAPFFFTTHPHEEVA